MNLIDLSQEHFYPRPPRGGRHTCFLPPAEVVEISIHALREEGDRKSTRRREHTHISIHALREEGDSAPRAVCSARRNFYPRPPRGGRPKKSTNTKAKRQFLSTPSARRATTLLFLFVCRYAYFYPRPPRGGRPEMTKCNVRYFDFYPRPPRGGRPLILFFRFPNTGISIHALREEGDHPAPAQNTGRCNFYPRPPRGGRLTMFASSMPSILNFYPRPPRGGRPKLHA